MQSPFKIFRKYQTILLATAAVAAIIMFTIGDSLSKMSRGGSRSQGPVVVETNVGTLKQANINELVTTRKLANQFMYRVFVAANPEYERFGMFFPQVARRFGGESTPDVVYAWLHRHEARKMGIVIDDKRIEAYIDLNTNKKLSSAQFRDILKQMGLNPKQLYDILREELLSLLAYQMTSPSDPLAPEQYWKLYQQFNTRQKIEVVALPIKDFAAKVPDPTDGQIATFFESHKNEFEGAFDGEFKPGFRQPQKINLHALRLSYLDVESEVIKKNPVTDNDITEFYEQKKDIDRSLQDFENPRRDDSTPIDPEFAPDKKGNPTADEPSEETADDDSKDKPDANPDDQPDEPQGKPKTEPPSESKADDEAGAKQPSDPCGANIDESTEQPEEPETDKSTSPDKQKPPAGEQPATDEPGASEDSETDPDLTDKTPADDAPSDPATKKDKKPSAGKKPAAPPAPRYKVLDDDLRGVIKDRLIHDRTDKVMKERTRQIADRLRDLGLKLITGLKQPPGEEDLARLADESRTGLKRIAAEFDLTFEETKLVSPRELSEIPGLGKAEEFASEGSFRGGSTSIVEQAFKGEALCRVLTAEGPGPDSAKASVDTYIYWKVADVPAHVGTLAEPGVREQVIEAWKHQEALPLAKERAHELAERVRTSTKLTAEALDGETITGDPGGLAVAVSQSREFTWWRESSVPNTQFGQSRPTVQLGNPIVVTNAGHKFMEFAFSELQEGDVGSSINDDASVYYVVKVLSRRPATREGFKNAVLFGGNTPYEQLASREQQMAKAEFDRRLEKKYALKWHEAAAGAFAPVPDDE